MENEGVLFSLRAGHQIGTGHLLRCLNIAQHLVGKTPIFFSVDGDEVQTTFAKEKGITVLEPWRVRDLYPRVVVVDRLEIEPPSLVPFKEKKVTVILLDSLSGWEMADVLVNALPHLPYQHQPPARLKIFEGPNYISLNDDFRHGHRCPRPVRDVVSKILITCGGSDPYGLTIKLAEALVKGPHPPSMTFIIGRLFEDKDVLERIILGEAYTIYQNVESLAPFMMEADIILTSFGLTVYEAACLGVPTIMLPPSEDHAQRSGIFAKFGSAINLGLNEEVSLKEIIDEVENLRSNFGLRQRMSQAGKDLVDGEGALRVAQIILDLL